MVGSTKIVAARHRRSATTMRAGLIAVALGAGGAWAQTPAERCEGTLCDLYYSTHPAPSATDAKATSAATSPAPATGAAPASGGLTNWFSRGPGPVNSQPSAPASATNDYVSLGAGGVLGPKQERCSGTLCDLYYGSKPSADSPVGGQQASATPAAAEPAVPRRHLVHESETRPKCSSPAADPWRCFR